LTLWRLATAEAEWVSSERRFDVFFSYAHADEWLAQKLYRGLQSLARPFWRLRPALTIYRDAEHLPPSNDLRQALYEAIAASDWFLLLATPASAESDFVRDEVWQFLATHPRDHLLVATTADPKILWDRETNAPTANAPFHPDLRRVFSEEPAMADLSWARQEGETELSLKDARFVDRVAFLQAPPRSTTKEALIGAEHALRRRARRVRTSIGVALAVLAIAASVEAVRATTAQHRAEEQQQIAETRRLAAQSELLAETNPSLSALLAIEAHDLDPEQPEATRRLAETARSPDGRPPGPSPCSARSGSRSNYRSPPSPG
jgi:hypothetical protein